MITRICEIIPMRIQSVSNLAEHWSKKSSRNRKQKKAVGYILSSATLNLPCTVTLTRIAPRLLDAEDNLPSAMKHIKDAVADVLIKGMAPGRADGDDRITWQFRQEKGKVREYALKIEIECHS